jgi:U4/U6.U5 tri-snRNP-associated protein 1
MSEEVLELSIEETNKLRAELGLKPLNVPTPSIVHGDSSTGSSSRLGRNNINADSAAVTTTINGGGGGGGRQQQQQQEEEVLELSIDETNKLRANLGLPPLRVDGGSGGKKNEVFKPAENIGDQQNAAERINQAKLRREVEEGATTVFGVDTLASSTDTTDGREGSGVLSWATKMRQQTEREGAAAVAVGKKRSKKNSSKNQTRSDGHDEDNYDERHNDYGSRDLEGMQVAHSMAELEAGSSTVLTLADVPILETRTLVSNQVVGLNDAEDALENVNFSEREKHQDGLRKKRMLEMGMGRAGGYAGFDDEEFEELGGTLGPSRSDRGQSGRHPNHAHDDEGDGVVGKSRGFRLGLKDGTIDDLDKSDLDRVQEGKAISLVGNVDVTAQDYMTIEEEEAEREKRHKKKKDTKFKKNKRKDKKRKRRTETYDGDDGDDDDDDEAKDSMNPLSTLLAVPSTSLISQLEQTSSENNETGGLTKRRTIPVRDEEDQPISMHKAGFDVVDEQKAKRAKFDAIMEKGNQKTRSAFNMVSKTNVQNQPAMDDEPDDSFLNAALAKARRLNRLREMNKTPLTGAHAVAQAVKSNMSETDNVLEPSHGTLTFSIDDTREFSRAIRARSQQKEREVQKNQVKDPPNNDYANGSSATANDPGTSESSHSNSDTQIKVEDVDDEQPEDVDMEQLAKEVVPDYGSTSESTGVGRGLSSFISMLKTTGEITGKHGGKEELRGRAKDERNYDNYEPLDLSKVVTIGRSATEKDKEFATREIKLEYRDKHGRLLTQKEAFRDLCYQFHGHGASKRKEEKRLKQITREQAEARLASSQVSAARDGTTAGTLGALKATQKATGKAFIVHKT